ncbi:hypothetical protein Sango_0284400 [Sesamum angolense]|uniref:Alpha-ketoglutarate-dependent dioxygenase AlkB-like domain-containing protein n=1 Tax=Sesamum angolense TaxID=2727404 RepID=A0AAE1X828_9LAMI|nr:hypothetical protein Sango_0284400 [Sesamum angolense]
MSGKNQVNKQRGEMEEELKGILREAFGDSSSDSDGESSHHRQGRVLVSDSTDEVVKPHSIFGDTDIWEPITEIKGLWICRDFLSTDQQASLISALQKGNEGICAHVDLMRFEDGIAIISLESSCVMHFSPAKAEISHLENVKEEEKVPVLLTPGSVVLMWGEARYLWKHEINRKPGFQTWEGQDINQKRRISVTLRRLCPTK